MLSTASLNATLHFYSAASSTFYIVNPSPTEPGYALPLQTVFVCVEVLRPSQPNGVMSSAVSLPNHTFTGQA